MAEDKAGLSEPSTHTLDATASSNSISAQLTALDDAISTFRKGASNYADAALGTAAQSLAYGTSVLLGQAQEGKALACQAYKAGKQHVDAGLHEAAMAEEFVVSSLKSGIAAAALAPTYVTYPALAISTFMVLPWTRRILYNNTLGRFRSVDAIAQLCEGRVSGLKGTLEEVQAQSKELAEKARMAEDEMRWVCMPA